jgi:PAS domain S-box-containing protein
LPAIFFSLWIGGFPCALFSSVFSALGIDFFLTIPLHSFRLSLPDFVKDVFFLALMLTGAWLLERARLASERDLRLKQKLIDSAESILITDMQHKLVYWSHGAERLFGWTSDEVLGKDPQALLQTSYPEPRENSDLQLQRTGHWHGQLHCKRKDGSCLVIESSWALDEETGNILQTCLDITAQASAEAKLRRANRALNAHSRVNQALLHATTEDELMHHAVEIIVQEGGYPLAWVGIPQHDPEHNVRIAAGAGNASDYLKSLRITWNDEPLGRGPTGTALREVRPVVVQDFLSSPMSAPWRDNAEAHRVGSGVSLPMIVQGQVVAALSVYALEKDAFEHEEFRSISELAAELALGIHNCRLKVLAEENHKAKLVLEEQFRQAQKMEAVGRLAGGIAHDFNNLLMVIMAQTELLSLHLDDTDLTKAESITRSARKAADLTSQLLAFSRKQIVQAQILSLNPIITELARMAEHLVGEDVDIALALEPQLWSVKADRSQLEQVIMNLIVNARDAMPQGGKLMLETSNANLSTEYLQTYPIVPPGRYVMLAVSDTGIGMDEATKSHIFEPFFTTKEPGKGTGLGLSLVYGIVKQSNGFVWCYSEPGHGACFKIYLPVSDAPGHDLAEKSIEDSSPAIDHATVLLVENEASLREVIAEFLRSSGHTVIAAESHEEAMKRAAENGGRIDLLLTDVVLRGRNGKQLANSLRESGFHFKVIFMSGYTPSAIVHHGVLDEGTFFLQKPFTRTDLLKMIQQVLHP